MNFFVFGNDERQEELKRLLGNGDIKNAKYIVLPPRFEDAEALQEIADGAVVFGCILSDALKDIIKKKNCKFFNYFASEQSQLANAVPTAEAAIFLASELTQNSISSMSFAILGYGRIGKELAAKLAFWKAEVAIYSRENNNLDKIKDADVLFNTIPAEILSLNTLKRINGVLIDLASVACASEDDIKASNVNFKRALALPAKYMPKAAAEIIKDEIRNIIKENNL